MPLGPGKYDAECSRVMKDTKAEAVIVLVVGGTRGHGFSLQYREGVKVEEITQGLRAVAHAIERETSS